METHKIDSAPPNPVTPRDNERAAGMRTGRPAEQRANGSAAPTASISVSLEVSVTLRVEMRVLQAQQGRAGEALGEIDTARSGLGRMHAHLTKLRAYAETASRADDPAVRDAYAQTFRMAQGWFADLQGEVQMPGGALEAVTDEALTLAPVDPAQSGTTAGAASAQGDLLSGVPRPDAIFDAVRAPGLGDFSSRSSLGRALAILDRSLDDVGSLRSAYDVMGQRLRDRITNLAAEMANVEAATSVPESLDEASSLAVETRDQVEQDARRAIVAQGVPSPMRLLDLLEE